MDDNPYLKAHLSPNGRYKLILDATEVRMSHWVERPWVCELTSGAILLDLSNTLWHVDAFRWSEDSSHLTLAMRRYPGDGPDVSLEIDLGARTCQVKTWSVTETPTLEALPEWLETYYRLARLYG
jgi:hypothetical protein